jgi:hypothetical protein
MEINAALLHEEPADVILDTVAPCTGLIWIVSLFNTPPRKSSKIYSP